MFAAHITVNECTPQVTSQLLQSLNISACTPLGY